MDEDRSKSGAPDGLGMVPPREWVCTTNEAIWCPVHGDCTCKRVRDRACPLHGSATNHPCGSVLR